MAARKRQVRLSEEWRERIRSAAILQRLDRAAMGEVDMTPSQLKAAEIVLRKTIPDLNKTELSGPDGGKIQMGAHWGKPQ